MVFMSQTECSIRVHRLGLSLWSRSGPFAVVSPFGISYRVQPEQQCEALCTNAVMLTELRIGRRLLLLLKFQ